MANIGEWWFYPTGENTLRGAYDDIDNPPMLPDYLIIDLIMTIPEARASFERIVPQMLPGEQDRLWPLIREGCGVSLANDYVAVEDNFQRAQNTGGVRTCGPRGGGGWAPPPMEK